MLRFLSKFNLSTRIYAGFLFLGGYAVLICFAAMFAVGHIHGEYAKADGMIENARRLSALETDLFSLNRSLFFFASKGTDEERANAEDALAAFEEKAREVESGLTDPRLRDKYQTVLKGVLEKYKAGMTEMFSLRDKSAKTADKVNQFAEKASTRLNALIEETTLPSVLFALNALREQFDAVLLSVENVSADNAASRKQMAADFAKLKKAQNTAKQAEMVNMKQLKQVFDAMGRLDDEINRKLKIDGTLRDKRQTVTMIGNQNAQDFKDVSQLVNQACAKVIANAEDIKISLQKAFVFAAAFGGFLAVALSFLSLTGIQYPLARLIETVQKMARGDSPVLIHFTERQDEVGALARALTELLKKMNGFSFPNGEISPGYGGSFGSEQACVPLMTGAEQENGGDDIAYFGQGVGVDAEKQLCQMLALVQHISASAAAMTGEIKARFASCRENLDVLSGRLTQIKDSAARAGENSAAGLLNGITAQIDAFDRPLSLCLSLTDEMQKLLKKQNEASESAGQRLQQMQNFASGLVKWTQGAGELTDIIRSLAAETKILALNASIESAKAGEKAKPFGSVASDMRLRTDKAAKAADQLAAYLVSVQKETLKFGETLKSTISDVAASYREAQAFAPVRDNLASQIKTVLDGAAKTRVDMAEYSSDETVVRRALTEIPSIAEQAMDAPSVLEKLIADASERLDGFNSSLPTYEEDGESEN